jgi:hypothetical protein
MRANPVFLATFLLISACVSDTGDSSGTTTGSGGATGGSGGGRADGGSGGSSTEEGSGGAMAGSGGEMLGGGGSDAAIDEDASVEAEAPDVGALPPEGGHDAGADATEAGRYWLSPCAKDWTREMCCEHYCGCMMANCAAELPADCQNACVTATTWKLDCRVEQCFESLNPHVPQDALSHCKHAIEKPTKCQNLQP